MGLTESRSSSSEQQRTASLLQLIPANGQHALDVGARGGHFSVLMAERFERVTALDLTEPNVSHPRVRCLEGNAAAMQFPDESFDFVLCTEILEHVPTSLLFTICREVERVASRQIVIGVPYKQDIRVGRTTCYSCNARNPPWGHVNSFDEQRVTQLFPHCEVETIAFVGLCERTNWLSAALMDFAGNPYGTYHQEEPCVRCGQRLLLPPQRNVAQRVATRLAVWVRSATSVFARSRGNWMHVKLRKIGDAEPTAAEWPRG